MACNRRGKKPILGHLRYSSGTAEWNKKGIQNSDTSADISIGYPSNTSQTRYGWATPLEDRVSNWKQNKLQQYDSMRWQASFLRDTVGFHETFLINLWPELALKPTISVSASLKSLHETWCEVNSTVEVIWLRFITKRTKHALSVTCTHRRNRFWLNSMPGIVTINWAQNNDFIPYQVATWCHKTLYFIVLYERWRNAGLYERKCIHHMQAHTVRVNCQREHNVQYLNQETGTIGRHVV